MQTSGAELSCSGGGSSFTEEVVLSGACEDAGAREVVWLAEGMSGLAVAAGFSMLGPALELEACSGARGALKERKHQVSNQREKYVRNDAKERNLPRGDGSLPFGLGHTNLLPFWLLGCVGLGLHASLLAGTSAGGRRSLVQRGGIDNHVVRDS
jgi:hypothetical protein